MTAGGVDIIEQGPRGPRRARIAALVALAAVPFIVILASRDTSRPAPEPPEPPTPVREVVTVRPNAVYPAASGTGGTRTMRVTFPDGSRAELTYPAGLNLASLGARPYASGTLTGDGTSERPHSRTGGEPRSPTDGEPHSRTGGQSHSRTGGESGSLTGAGAGGGGSAGGGGDAGAGEGAGGDAGGGGEFRSLTAPLYGEAETAAGRPMIRHLTGDVTLWPGPLGVDTAGPVLLFAFGDWRIALQDERAGMTFEQRLAWAQNLRGTLTPDGFLTLSAGGPLRLSPVLVHLAQPQNLGSVQNFLNAYRDNGGRWDITGLSSYAQGGNVAPVLDNMHTIQSTYGRPVMHVEYGGPLNKPTQVRDSLRAFVTGLKSFGGLGTFYWEPEVYSPFATYGSGAWDPATLRPTAAMDGFLNV